MWQGMAHGFAVGIDENGLGPRLGPLVVTSILARTSTDETRDGEKVANARPKGALRKRLGDSKKLVSFGDSALGEAWARALLRRAGEVEPAAVDELVHALALDPRTELRAPCPDAHADQCWSAEGERYLAEPKLLAQLARDLDRLAAAGVEILRARVAIVCTKRLNEATVSGRSRFQVDLHAMERLVLRARADAGADVAAVCGKVGGFDRYVEHFGPLGGRPCVAVREGRARSTYAVPGVGTIAFVRDADASNLLVCLASLVGKWVRDLLMTRIVRYHRAHDPGLPDASGYHDPITTRFVAASALSRARRQLPDACFERTSLEREAALAEATSSRRPPPPSSPARKARSRSATP